MSNYDLWHNGLTWSYFLNVNSHLKWKKILGYLEPTLIEWYLWPKMEIRMCFLNNEDFGIHIRYTFNRTYFCHILLSLSLEVNILPVLIVNAYKNCLHKTNTCRILYLPLLMRTQISDINQNIKQSWKQTSHITLCAHIHYKQIKYNVSKHIFLPSWLPPQFVEKLHLQLNVFNHKRIEMQERNET